jgi:hypothetical protein
MEAGEEEMRCLLQWVEEGRLNEWMLDTMRRLGVVGRRSCEDGKQQKASSTG